MAFMRYACARVTSPQTRDWDRVRVASGNVRAGRNLVEQAEKILKADFDPEKYLLTHATIVASVDTVKVPGAKLGAATDEGKKIVRKTTAYRVKPGCDKYINNNNDAWSRGVLLKSYPTFVGGHSFLEHVQIEKLSKGRIIDAVARDVGDSIYVDILVANNRKHQDLCEKIESGELSTLSMGCSIDGSTCTRCGHWAADETEFCDHVRHEKGNYFYDDNGVKCRIAELCGDESLEPTGGVKFVEASWVGLPAFEGAVARNVVGLGTSKKKSAVADRIERAFGAPLPEIGTGAFQKAARMGGFGGEPEEEESAPPPPSSEKNESPLSDIQNEIQEVVLDEVRDNLKTEITKKKIEEQVAPSDSPNDSIVKQAHARGVKAAYEASVRAMVKTSSSDADLLNRVATLNEEIGISIPVSLYRAALRIGPRNTHRDLPAFLKTAGNVLGRPPSNNEAVTLVRLAALLEAHQTARRTAENR